MTIRSFEGKTPRLGKAVYVDEAALVIGDVAIGDDSSIWPGTVVRGDVHGIVVGAGTNVQDNSVLHVTHDSEYAPGGYALRVGDGVTVGHRVILHGCTVEDHCLIGMGAVVMDGAHVEAEVMLGAGSLVTPGKRLASGHLWMGAPARQARPLTETERAYLRYSARHYIALKRRHAEDGSTAR
ncbi:MAG: gamma carbonic anhydrase family protein [Gammaproteobacteria bacterium]|nr:gamma carbonic anhydrase family protein [Gammaproteobacteria bacterium]